MTIRERFADWITGGALTKVRDDHRSSMLEALSLAGHNDVLWIRLSRAEALIEKWDGMTCRSTCADELRKALGESE